MDMRYQIELKDAGQGVSGRIDKAYDSTLKSWVAMNYPAAELRGIWYEMLSLALQLSFIKELILLWAPVP